MVILVEEEFLTKRGRREAAWVIYGYPPTVTDKMLIVGV